jgi:transposase
MSDPHSLTTDDKTQLTAILAACPELAALRAHVAAFADLMTQRRGRELESWITAAAASGLPELRSFVTGLRRDQDAVTAGLTLPITPASSKATSTASRCSNAKCTDAPVPICSAAASCSPTNDQGDRITQTVPEPNSSRQSHTDC